MAANEADALATKYADLAHDELAELAAAMTRPDNSVAEPQAAIRSVGIAEAEGTAQ